MHKTFAVNTDEPVNERTMMIRETVEMDRGQLCMILVNECQNHNEMTENAGYGKGAEVKKLVKDICR